MTTAASSADTSAPALKAVIRAGAACVAILAGLALAGWAFDLAGARTLLVGTATMKVNTALCFLLAGTSLAAATAGPAASRSAAWLAASAGIVGAATLLEYLAGADLGIDQFLMTDFDTPPDKAPGRMSAVTGAQFMLFAGALLTARRTARTAGRTFVALSMSGLTVALLALVGYAFGTPILHRPIPAMSIAFHTAVGFAILFAAAMLLRPDLGLCAVLRQKSAGGVLARWTLPAILLVMPVIGWLILRFELAGYYGAPLATAMFVISTIVVLVTVLWVSSLQADKLDKARREEQQLTRGVIEGSLDAFMLTDEAGRVERWSPQAEEMFGLPTEDAVGLSAAETLIAPESRKDWADGFAPVGDGFDGLKRRRELRALRHDGSAFPIELMVTPIRTPAGWVFGCILRDLSEQKRTEANLRQSQKMEAVGQLTGGVAHDFNNLLTVIIGSLDLTDEKLDEEQRSLIEAALAAATRGAALTHRLLAFSRQQTLAPSHLDLNALVRGMEDLIRRTLESSITIELRLKADLWPAFADASQIENALLNLAVNARDAMPEGGRLTIETANVHLDEAYAAVNAEVTPGPHAMLAVSDTGTGMPAAVIERAFDPFFTTKPHGKGTGLGLSMIYGFAKQSGGHLKIYSELGHGTTVRLYLPRAATADIAEAEVPTAADRLGAGETILVVEDDSHVRRLAVRQLRDLGYRTVEASDSTEATALLEDGTVAIDLLFTDIMMPGGMTGFDLAGKGRSARPGLKTLYTSGYAEGSVLNSTATGSEIVFLPKPYRRQELADKVAQALWRRPG